MSFEKKYYDDPSFWENDMLQDDANKNRIEYTANLVPQDVDSIVDIGCGNGVFVNYLSKTRPKLNILGLDRSEIALQFVNTKKQVGDISNLSLPSNSYDCVTCLEVIEHLPGPIYKQSLLELVRLSKKYLIISVPYLENLEESYNKCPACKAIFNKELHLRSYNEQSMMDLFTEFGFKCIKLDKLGESVIYKGHFTFRKYFYKEQFRRWQSPICPICGYQENTNETNNTFSNVLHKKNIKQTLISDLTYFPKLLWPKEKKYYWIIGLYEKESK